MQACEVIVPGTLLSVLLECALRSALEVWKAQAALEPPSDEAPMGGLRLKVTLQPRVAVDLRYRLNVSDGGFRLEPVEENSDPGVRFLRFSLQRSLEGALEAALRQVAGPQHNVVSVLPRQWGLQVRYQAA